MINTLWNLGHPYTAKHVVSKYDILSHQFDNYRVLYLNDLITHKDLSIPTFVRNFIVKEGAVFMIANLIDGKPISILFRSLNKKAFIDYGTTKGVFYGIGTLSPNFRYGDPIVVVEGVADRDVLSKIYPNVVATKSSSLSMLQIELLASLTNRVILALDQDDPGRHGCRLALSRLRKKHLRAYILDHPDVKDPGTIYDYLVAKNKDKVKELFLSYSSKIKEAMKCLN